jgi:hypothetical protein
MELDRERELCPTVVGACFELLPENMRLNTPLVRSPMSLALLERLEAAVRVGGLSGPPSSSGLVDSSVDGPWAVCVVGGM